MYGSITDCLMRSLTDLIELSEHFHFTSSAELSLNADRVSKLA